MSSAIAPGRGCSLDLGRLRRLLADQDGVVARRQILAVGGDDNDIERLVRRRLLVRVWEGVYVDHTGVMSWRQIAWAAVLVCWPAALSHESALAVTSLDRLEQGRPVRPGEVVHVAVDASRRVTPRPGVVVHRVADLDARALWNLGPPRIRHDEALLDAAAMCTRPVDALALVAEACQQGRTTPARVASALSGRARLRHGRWLRSVVEDVAAGVRSVLEHGYLVRVERAHGLPAGRRQARSRSAAGVVIYRDVDYSPYRTVVELDGRLGHEASTNRWADLARDLDAQAGGAVTLRLTWPQVFDSPCRTAEAVGRVLASRGWGGSPVGCGPKCLLDGKSPESDA